MIFPVNFFESFLSPIPNTFSNQKRPYILGSTGAEVRKRVELNTNNNNNNKMAAEVDMAVAGEILAEVYFMNEGKVKQTTKNKKLTGM